MKRSSITGPTQIQERRVHFPVLEGVPIVTFMQFMVLAESARMALRSLSGLAAIQRILVQHSRGLMCAVVALVAAATAAVDYLAWNTDRLQATFYLHESFSTEVSGWYGPGTWLALMASVISGGVTLIQAAWHRRPPTAWSGDVLAVVVYSCASGWDILSAAPKAPTCGYSASWNFQQQDQLTGLDPSSVAQAFLAVAAAIRATAFTSIVLQFYSVLLSVHIVDGLTKPWTRQRWIALIQFILVFGASDATLFALPVYDWYHNRNWHNNREWYHPNYQGFGTNNDLICLRQWEGKGTITLLPHSLPGAKFQHLLFGTTLSSLNRRTNFKIALRTVFPVIFAWFVILGALAILARHRTSTFRKRAVVALGIIVLNFFIIPIHSYLYAVVFRASDKALPTLWDYVKPGQVDTWIRMVFYFYLAFLLFLLAFVVYPAYSVLAVLPIVSLALIPGAGVFPYSGISILELDQLGALVIALAYHGVNILQHGFIWTWEKTRGGNGGDGGDVELHSVQQPVSLV